MMAQVWDVRWLAVVAMLFDAVASDNAEKPPVGCFYNGFKFFPHLGNVQQPIKVSSTVGCQKACANNTDCTTFTYFDEYDDCYLGDMLSNIQWDASATSGPRVCKDTPPACRATLPQTFPGNTAQATLDVMASSTGLVPPKLQCWPRGADNEIEQCTSEDIKVLEDYNDGWLAQCDSIYPKQLAEGQTCEELCKADVFCASWQLVNNANGPECWTGIGYNCFNKDRGLKPVGAQRLQRGHVRVLKDLTGIQVYGLAKVFPISSFDSSEDAIPKCRETCYSSIECSVWIYSIGAQFGGCWVEDVVKSRIQWPPTTDTFDASTTLGKTVVAGEYIQHQCGNFAKPQAPSAGSDQCSDHPRCAGFSGSCCPTPLGKTLGCCNSLTTALGAVGSRDASGITSGISSVSMTNAAAQTPLNDISIKPTATALTQPPSTSPPTTTSTQAIVVSDSPVAGSVPPGGDNQWWKSTWFVVGVSVVGAAVLAVAFMAACRSGKRPSKKKRGVSRDMELAESEATAAAEESGLLTNTSESGSRAGSYVPSNSNSSIAWDPSMPLFGTPALLVPSLQHLPPGAPMMPAAGSAAPGWA